jgi:hypothetical protein
MWLYIPEENSTLNFSEISSYDHQARAILFLKGKALAPVLHIVLAHTSFLEAVSFTCDEQAAH